MQFARTLDLLRLGPNERISFQRDVMSPERVAQVIAGFANAQGGTIIFGADKRGQIVGLSDVHKATGTIIRAAQLVSPDLLIEPYVVSVEDHQVMLLDVPRGADTPYTTADGRIWVRQGQRTTVASSRQAAELAQRAVASATFVPLAGSGSTGRLQAKSAAPAVDLDHIMLKLERLIIANAELAHKLDDANSWRSRLTDQVIGAVLGLAVSGFVFYVLGIG